jgi:hypothetical protein
MLNVSLHAHKKCLFVKLWVALKWSFGFSNPEKVGRSWLYQYQGAGFPVCLHTGHRPRFRLEDYNVNTHSQQTGRCLHPLHSRAECTLCSKQMWHSNHRWRARRAQLGRIIRV